MLSKKTRYAMVALLRLAKEYDRGAIAISTISEEERIPQRFLEGILLELKKTGIVESIRGKSGGYYLVKNPSEVNLADIIMSFEGSLGMLSCICSNKYRPCEFCKDETLCKLRKTFQYVYESSSAILKSSTLSDLI